MRIRYKSWLCSSPLRANLVEQAQRSGADIIHFDLEDSVPAKEKESARKDIQRSLSEAGQGTVALRINSPASIEGIRDLLWLVESGLALDILILPKIESAAEIRNINCMLGEMQRRVELFAIIETLAGLNELEHIAGSGGFLRGLILGAADLSAQLGVQVNSKSFAMYQVKHQIAVACARYQLLAIDSPCFSINNENVLLEELELAKDFGFAGKIAIHPKQIAAINRAFMPSESELAHAQAVLNSLEHSAGNIADLEGQMLGPPFAKMARNIVKRAESAGE